MIAIPGTEDGLRRPLAREATYARVESTCVDDDVNICGKYVFHLF
jgi:hypothetical protein